MLKVKEWLNKKKQQTEEGRAIQKFMEDWVNKHNAHAHQNKIDDIIKIHLNQKDYVEGKGLDTEQEKRSV